MQVVVRVHQFLLGIMSINRTVVALASKNLVGIDEFRLIGLCCMNLT
jgi:hypothetical protein